MIRAEAAVVVKEVIIHNRSLDRVFEESSFNSDQQEKSIFKAICYGTIRFHWELKNKIYQLVERPIRNKDRIIEILLETAIFQIESMRIPHHAIVSQTVEATKLLNKKNLSAFVNGILREYLRASKNTDCEDEEVIYNHPQWIINKTRDNWPKNFTEILKNNNLQAPMWLRVNQKK
ncbi:MAG: transcription antitermination factor NusB, partial [Pseudomonadota bacterium]|nr:transcription antitermination factor NusB [Pseudomonadota bacterium]